MIFVGRVPFTGPMTGWGLKVIWVTGSSFSRCPRPGDASTSATGKELWVLLSPSSKSACGEVVVIYFNSKNPHQQCTYSRFPPTVTGLNNTTSAAPASTRVWQWVNCCRFHCRYVFVPLVSVNHIHSFDLRAVFSWLLSIIYFRLFAYFVKLAHDYITIYNF